MSLSVLLENMAKAIVDKPEEVSVAESTEADGTILLELTVSESDMGKIIGRRGRIARAIRSVMRAAGSVSDSKVFVKIK